PAPPPAPRAGLSGRAKDEDIAPPAYLAHAEAQAREAEAQPGDDEGRERAARDLELARTFAACQSLMAREGLVDFGDQIVYALRLFRTRPYVLSRYQRRVPYPPVAEFQDTNHAPFAPVPLLGPRPPHLA